jgi:hypothetical protein
MRFLDLMAGGAPLVETVFTWAQIGGAVRSRSPSTSTA